MADWWIADWRQAGCERSAIVNSAMASLVTRFWYPYLRSD